MANLPLAFAEAGVGAMLLVAGISGSTFGEVIRGTVSMHPLVEGDTPAAAGGNGSGVTPSGGPAVDGATSAGPQAFADMLAEAGKIEGAHFNYEWAGGHNATFAPTAGSGHGSGPGIGYDCSGAISAILYAAGLINAPMVAADFMTYGLPGPGGPHDLTIYSSPTHVFAEINGRFFGTSMSNPGGGAGWFTRAETAGYTVRHITLKKHG